VGTVSLTEAVSGPAKTWLLDPRWANIALLSCPRFSMFLFAVAALVSLRYVIIGAYFDGVGGGGVDDTAGPAGEGIAVVGGR